jgi:hypothetical protein
MYAFRILIRSCEALKGNMRLYSDLPFLKILICTVELIKAEKSIMEMSWKGDVRKSPGVD